MKKSAFKDLRPLGAFFLYSTTFPTVHDMILYYIHTKNTTIFFLSGSCSSLFSLREIFYVNNTGYDSYIYKKLLYCSSSKKLLRLKLDIN